MGERKLTKEDIDRVRSIEGFPIAKDEDIIALSRPPYYTACPNPFIEDFIRAHGTPYDEETDDYHCEPFAASMIVTLLPAWARKSATSQPFSPPPMTRRCWDWGQNFRVKISSSPR
jgi:hypothetical protein